MKKLHDSILDILEENDFSVCSIDEQNGETVAELEWYSPLGEDVIVTIWYDGSDADFIRKFQDYAEDFDAEEHAAMWVNSRGGGNGVPNSIRDLLDDADAIDAKLCEVARYLESAEV